MYIALDERHELATLELLSPSSVLIRCDRVLVPIAGATLLCLVFVQSKF